MTIDKIGTILRKNMMLIVLIGVVIFFEVGTNGKLLGSQNVNSLISQNGYVFILATGMLLCILTGGNIDLSVGSIICFTEAVGAVLLSKHLPLIVAVVVILIIGLLIGMFQGYWVAWIKVPPFIATLAGMYTFRGLSNTILQGKQVPIDNENFKYLFGGGNNCYVPDFLGGANLNLTCMVVGLAGVLVFILLTIKGWADRKKAGVASANMAGDIAKLVIISALIIWVTYKLANHQGIPTVLIWIALVLLIYGYITNYTSIGRYFYAVGGNEKATRLSGINTKLVYFIAYANMGFLAGFAALLTMARSPQATPQVGVGYEMDAIAACFIGGASAYGGVGKVSGMIIGATLMGIINLGMTLMHVPDPYKSAVKGAVLLSAIILDVLSKKEKA